MKRREFIVLGTSGLVGASLMDVLASKHNWRASKEGKAKNVINLSKRGIIIICF